MISIHEINLDERCEYNNILLAFEKLFKYPFGKDYFKIDHGENYFNFFDRLGEPYFFVAKESKDVLAVCVAILREINTHMRELVWYLCDLKVHPNHQGCFIVQKILNYAFPKCFKISKKVYGISMNEEGYTFNKLLRFARRLPYLNLRLKCILRFYLLDKSETKSKMFIENNSFVSLSGIKDLILESSDKPLHFMHYVTLPQKITNTTEEMKFMICCPQNSEISSDFQECGVYPIATASVLANFEPNSWDFIKSADI